MTIKQKGGGKNHPTLEQFKHWLYELDEQELCDSREKIVAFIKKTRADQDKTCEEKLEHLEAFYKKLVKAEAEIARASMKAEAVKVAEDTNPPNEGSEAPSNVLYNSGWGSAGEAIAQKIKAL